MVKECSCNLCGKKMSEYDLQGDYVLQPFGGTAEYGSRHDGDVVYVQLCSVCFDEIVDRCVISPIEED